MTPWLLLDLVLAIAAIVAAALYITRPVPPPEGNRPAAPGLIEQNEQARIASLRSVAARQQRQREASARISRGF